MLTQLPALFETPIKTCVRHFNSHGVKVGDVVAARLKCIDGWLYCKVDELSPAANGTVFAMGVWVAKNGKRLSDLGFETRLVRIVTDKQEIKGIRL